MKAAHMFGRRSLITLAVVRALCSVEGETQAEVGGSAPSAPNPGAGGEGKPAKAKKEAKKPAAKKAAKKPAKKAAKKAKKADGDAVTGPAVLRQYAPNYTKGGADGKAKTAGGNVAVDSNDKLAQKLRGMDLDDVYKEAVKILVDKDENPFTMKALKEKYAHLNVGMQRMNLGNRMRAILNAK